MNNYFPEAPIFFYPSLAREIGTDEALLYSIYTNYLQAYGQLNENNRLCVTIPYHRWQKLVDCWLESRLIKATFNLKKLGFIRVASREAGITLELKSSLSEDLCNPPPVASEALNLNPVDAPCQRSTTAFRGIMDYGDYRAQSESTDRFSSVMKDLEQKGRKYHFMHLGWRPSPMLFAVLPKARIPVEFAESLIDDFVIYWLDKSLKVSNWDQKFLAWVKREWGKTREPLEHDNQKQGAAEVSQELPHTHSIQNRWGVAASILDVRNVDW